VAGSEDGGSSPPSGAPLRVAGTRIRVESEYVTNRRQLSKIPVIVVKLVSCAPRKSRLIRELAALAFLSSNGSSPDSLALAVQQEGKDRAIRGIQAVEGPHLAYRGG